MAKEKDKTEAAPKEAKKAETPKLVTFEDPNTGTQMTCSKELADKIKAQWGK